MLRRTRRTLFAALRPALCLLVASLTQPLEAQTGAAEFQSNWEEQPSRVWIGPEYWANPMQDWRIQDGRLECIQAGVARNQDRNVQLLTWQLTPKSRVRMRVTAGRLSDAADGWAGFRIGNRGLFNEYRHNCIWGKGIDAGLTTAGRLFLDDQTAAAPFDGPRTIELTITPVAGRSRVKVSVLDAGGAAVQSVQKDFEPGALAGNLALVAHATGNQRRGQFYFEDWRITGDGLAGGPRQNWGPILWSQYTLSRNVLRLSVQFPPIGPEASREVTLLVRRGDTWAETARAEIDSMARVAMFRVEDWDSTKDAPYRVVYRDRGRTYAHEGTIRRDPVDKAEILVAGFTGNKDFGFPNREIVANLHRLDPDVLFFSGDQIYETVAGYGIQREPVEIATLDYLRKWYLLGWSFGEVLKDRPSVILPDDHDVYQGNIWGQGGRPIVLRDGEQPGNAFPRGGYVMDPSWVNMVQRTQTAHLPDPFDPAPIEQGIGVCYTDMVYGRISFAILEDRKFKTGPANYDAGDIREAPGAELLGERQLRFLRHWAQDWRGSDLKATLSQTVFAQCHTHGGNQNRHIEGDLDANGWPPHARNQALREIRKAFAFMYAGDNHLPTVVHHGIDTWEDAGVSFTVPSIAAGYPRAWWPDKAGKTRAPGGPPYAPDLTAAGKPGYLGRYRSFWGHPLTFLAAANPRVFTGEGGDPKHLDDKSSGFGLVRFNKASRKITIECYRILADLDRPDTAQFPDWPITISQLDNYGRRPTGHLPAVRVTGLTNPVLQVFEQGSGELVYALRVNGTEFRPMVFGEGQYIVKVGDPDQSEMQTFEGLQPAEAGETLQVKFD